MPRGVKHLTEEWKQKISQWRPTEEQLKKMSIAQTGRKHSDITKRKIGRANSGKNSGHWKADKVSYGSLHEWIRNHLSKPEPFLCQSCKLVPPYDVHNIDGKYTRDLSMWVWWCRRCHLINDGRLARNMHNLELGRGRH